MIRYIDEHRRSFGVEPICRTLAIAPSSYYAAKARPPSARSVSDATLTDVIGRVHRANFGVYGSRKVWKALRRLNVDAGRDQVARVMRLVGLHGATRTKRVRTTRPATVEQRPADLVERVFAAPAPNRLWVADLTYVWTVRGFVYTAFVVDAFSRAIVGSVGSKGDSYDNALAESVNGLYKGELIERHKPWRTVEQVELATARWVDWWNRERLHSACGDVPPAEFEATYHQLRATTQAA